MTDEIFKEAETEFRIEQIRQRARRLAGVGIGLVIVLGVGAAGWSYRHAHMQEQTRTLSAAYIKALKDMGSDTSVAGTSAPLTDTQKAAITQLDRVATSGTGDIATLARLRLAASQAVHGDVKQALAQWNDIQTAATVDPQLRALATLLWCQWQLDDGDIPTLRSRLSLLVGQHDAFSALASEQLAALDIRTGDMKSATQKLTSLMQDPGAPSGVRMRAGALLQTLGAAG
ncbi:hypothetical protein AA0472_2832 [Acetobacter estunensis NRIC 0472]|uniref:Tetratricopeptide repeat-like domain-containing protein n=1 Tax=Acetobacter estunensis TaxID=104097 RepID=A0A967B7A8_9PROT|nr:hypothetical protein [Acetobacter estunensis]NHO53501.1 hypothetical protein [Acetobacter estunensis]GBQ28884.1 hypothetical protein AA0472_2832 [Acetobacter estunensis NRIC 0472]